jgi:hypothetical protein
MQYKRDAKLFRILNKKKKLPLPPAIKEVKFNSYYYSYISIFPSFEVNKRIDNGYRKK